MPNLVRHGRVCPVCGAHFARARSDARYCSGKCRMRILRQMRTPVAVAAQRGAMFLGGGPVAVPTAPARAEVAENVTDNRPRTVSVTPKGVARPSGKPKPKPKPKPKAKRLPKSVRKQVAADADRIVKCWEKAAGQKKFPAKKGRAK